MTTIAHIISSVQKSRGIKIRNVRDGKKLMLNLIRDIEDGHMVSMWRQIHGINPEMIICVSRLDDEWNRDFRYFDIQDDVVCENVSSGDVGFFSRIKIRSVTSNLTYGCQHNLEFSKYVDICSLAKFAMDEIDWTGQKIGASMGLLGGKHKLDNPSFKIEKHPDKYVFKISGAAIIDK